MKYFFCNIAILVSAVGVCLCLSLPVVSEAQKMIPQKEDKISAVETKSRNEMQWMQENLDLTNEQYDMISPICYNYFTKSDSADRIRDEHTRKMVKDECKKNKDAQIRKLLTSEQYSEYVSRKKKTVKSYKSPFSTNY